MTRAGVAAQKKTWLKIKTAVTGKVKKGSAAAKSENHTAQEVQAK